MWESRLTSGPGRAPLSFRCRLRACEDDEGLEPLSGVPARYRRDDVEVLAVRREARSPRLPYLLQAAAAALRPLAQATVGIGQEFERAAELGGPPNGLSTARYAVTP